MSYTRVNIQALIILLLLVLLVVMVAAYTIKSSQVASSGKAADGGYFPGDVIEWRMVTSWPKGFPGLGTGAEKFARRVEQMSGGRLLVRVYGAGEIVPAMGVFDAVSAGNIEMGHSASYYWQGKSPAMPFFTTVPFGMTAQETNAWLHYGGGMELWRELYSQFNVIPLAGGNTGVQMPGWFNKEINSIEDIKGLKLRLPGLGGDVFERVGGTSVNIPGGELYTSLRTGVIDAVEWVGPYNDMAMGFHEAAKYYYYPGWHEPGSTIEIIINQRAWASLPEDLQMIVATAARAANQDMLDEFTARNNDALQELIHEHGVKLRRLPDDVLLALKEASDEILAELVEGDDFARRVHKSYSEFAEGVSNYHRISEQAYINARSKVAE